MDSSIHTFSPSSSFESLNTSDIEAGIAAAPFPIYPSSYFPNIFNRQNSSSFSRSMVGPTPHSPRFFFGGGGVEEPHHFLDSCHLCKTPLGDGRDIYMYRGETPFCSEECRQEQIEMDEANDNETRLKMSKKKKQQQQQAKNTTSPSSKSEKIHVRAAGTVVAG